MYGTKWNLHLTSIELHPLENRTSFIRQLSFHYVSFSFYKHTAETNIPDPAPDNTQGESNILQAQG